MIEGHRTKNKDGEERARLDETRPEEKAGGWRFASRRPVVEQGRTVSVEISEKWRDPDCFVVVCSSYVRLWQ